MGYVKTLKTALVFGKFVSTNTNFLLLVQFQLLLLLLLPNPFRGMGEVYGAPKAG